MSTPSAPIRLATLAAEIVAFMRRTLDATYDSKLPVALDALLPDSVTARVGTGADRALASGGVYPDDMSLVIEAQVRGGRWLEMHEQLTQMFNVMGEGASGSSHLLTCATPPHFVHDMTDLPQVFTLIVRP